MVPNTMDFWQTSNAATPLGGAEAEMSGIVVQQSSEISLAAGLAPRVLHSARWQKTRGARDAVMWSPR